MKNLFTKIFRKKKKNIKNQNAENQKFNSGDTFPISETVELSYEGDSFIGNDADTASSLKIEHSNTKRSLPNSNTEHIGETQILTPQNQQPNGNDINYSVADTVLLSPLTNDVQASNDTVLLSSAGHLSVSDDAEKVESQQSIENLGECKVLLNNPASGEIIEIKSPNFLVGSGADCDLRIQKNEISHHHAYIFCDENSGVFLMDNKSTNLTKINGTLIEPMEKVKLSSGDLISFCNELYQVFIET